MLAEESWRCSRTILHRGANAGTVSQDMRSIINCRLEKPAQSVNKSTPWHYYICPKSLSCSRGRRKTKVAVEKGKAAIRGTPDEREMGGKKVQWKTFYVSRLLNAAGSILAMLWQRSGSVLAMSWLPPLLLVLLLLLPTTQILNATRCGDCVGGSARRINMRTKWV